MVVLRSPRFAPEVGDPGHVLADHDAEQLLAGGGGYDLGVDCDADVYVWVADGAELLSHAYEELRLLWRDDHLVVLEPLNGVIDLLLQLHLESGWVGVGHLLRFVVDEADRLAVRAVVRGGRAGRSFWLRMNKRQPRTDPWGTAKGPMVCGGLRFESIWTRNDLSDKYEENQSIDVWSKL